MQFLVCLISRGRVRARSAAAADPLCGARRAPVYRSTASMPEEEAEDDEEEEAASTCSLGPGARQYRLHQGIAPVAFSPPSCRRRRRWTFRSAPPPKPMLRRRKRKGSRRRTPTTLTKRKLASLPYTKLDKRDSGTGWNALHLLAALGAAREPRRCSRSSRDAPIDAVGPRGRTPIRCREWPLAAAPARACFVPPSRGRCLGAGGEARARRRRRRRKPANVVQRAHGGNAQRRG